MSAHKPKKSVEYEIMQGVPIPLKRGRGGPQYPFSTMKIGDSFHAPVVIGTLSCAAGRFRKHNPKFNYTIRTVEDGVRIWRIK